MTSPILTYDPDVRALYIQLSDADVLETIQLAKDVYLDIDADGEPVGFEILNADGDVLSSIPPLPRSMILKDLLASQAA